MKAVIDGQSLSEDVRQMSVQPSPDEGVAVTVSSLVWAEVVQGRTSNSYAVALVSPVTTYEVVVPVLEGTSAHP